MRSVPKFLCVMLLFGVVACDKGDPVPDPVPPVTIELPARLHWPAVDGAVEYRAQVWDGTRLLFQEPVTRPELRVTPAMQRSLLGASGARLEVRAYAADGRVLGEPWRESLGPG